MSPPVVSPIENPKSPHLVLIGLSFSGKSTVGALVAARLGLPFVDTDVEIEHRAGMSVPRIFEEQGEPAFRALEREVVNEVVAGPTSVIATGGGVPVDEANRRALWNGNLVVYLEAEAETVVQRLRRARAAASRPLLAGDDPLGRVRELKTRRESIYRQAHVTIRTDGSSRAAVAELVSREYLERGRG